MGRTGSQYQTSMLWAVIGHARTRILIASVERTVMKKKKQKKTMPFTYAMMLCGSLSFVGFPFLMGFCLKDLILELACAQYTLSGDFVWWLTL